MPVKHDDHTDCKDRNADWMARMFVKLWCLSREHAIGARNSTLQVNRYGSGIFIPSRVSPLKTLSYATARVIHGR